jgi:hypothetical protein
LREISWIGWLTATRLLQAEIIERRRRPRTLGDVRIDFGGFNAGVAEQILDNARVGASFHQVRSVAMAQPVQRLILAFSF